MQLCRKDTVNRLRTLAQEGLLSNISRRMPAGFLKLISLWQPDYLAIITGGLIGFASAPYGAFAFNNRFLSKLLLIVYHRVCNFSRLPWVNFSE